MKKFLNTTGGFVVIYLCLMIPTYILPYFGSNSVIANGAGAVVDVATGGKSSIFTHFPFILHLAFLLGLCYVSFIRGGIISKKWLVVFPIVAVIFDLTPGLSAIPFIASILHILAIVLGVVGINKATD